MTFAGCAAGQVAVGLAHVAFLHFYISFAVWLQDQMERGKNKWWEMVAVFTVLQEVASSHF